MTVWFAPTEESLLREWANPARLTRNHSLDLDFCYPYIDTVISSTRYAPELLVTDLFRMYFLSFSGSLSTYHAKTGIDVPILQDVTRGRPDRLSAREFLAHGYWGEARESMNFMAQQSDWDVSRYVRMWVDLTVDEWGLTR